MSTCPTMRGLVLYSIVGVIVVSGCSGEGNQALGSVVLINDIAVKVTTIGPLVRVIGTTLPRRLRFAGGYGIGYSTGDGTLSTTDLMVTWWHNIDWEFQNFINDTDQITYSDTLLWRLKPGLVADIAVYHA